MRSIALLLGSAFVAAVFGAALFALARSEPRADALPCTNFATATAIAVANQAERDFRIPDTELQCRIRRSLLTPGDLGSGWVVDQSDRSHGDVDVASNPPSICGVPSVGGIAALFRVLDRAPDLADDIPIIHQITVFGRGYAGDFMTGVRQACGLSAPSGSSTASREYEIPFEQLGDESILLASDGQDFSQRHLVVRYGNAISEVYHNAGDGEDTAIPSFAARAVDTRMRAFGDALHDDTVDHGLFLVKQPRRGTLEETLSGALFSRDDLGNSWLRVSARTTGDDGGLCDSSFLGFTVEPYREVGAHYYHGRFEALGVTVALYVEGEATRIVAALASLSATGRECTKTIRTQYLDADGRPEIDEIVAAVSISPLPFRQFGDASAAYRARTRSKGSTLYQWDFVIQRRGDLLAGLAYRGGSFTRPSADGEHAKTLELAEQLEQRLDRVWGSLTAH